MSTDQKTPQGSLQPDCSASKTWPYVQRFAIEMEAKLVANAHKGGPENWLSSDVWWLMERLRDEEKELRLAIQSGNTSAIVKEAADVANFAMMVASWFEERAMVLADIDATE